MGPNNWSTSESSNDRTERLEYVKGYVRKYIRRDSHDEIERGSIYLCVHLYLDLLSLDSPPVIIRIAFAIEHRRAPRDTCQMEVKFRGKVKMY